MTTEEKAKAYDEAIKRGLDYIRHTPATEMVTRQDIFEAIFPEFKESDDEKTRKTLISFLKSPFVNENITDEKVALWLAWLEKQGEDKHLELRAGKWYMCYRAYCCRADHLTVKEGERILCEKDGVVKGFVIKDAEKYFKECNAPAPYKDEQKPKWTEENEDSNVNDETNAPTEYGKYVDECLNEASKHFFSEGEDKYSVADLFYAGVRCGKSWFEKQCHQEEHQVYETKNGEVITYSESEGYEIIKPKFKVSDWVVDSCGYVLKILNQFYTLGDVEGSESRSSIGWVDKTFHLWTIADAKDGDTLVTYDIQGNLEWLFLYMPNKHKLHINDPRFYCHYDIKADSFKKDDDYVSVALGTKFHPATKEQRALLFSKMKEAGYEWDADKKELKEIHNALEDCEIENIEHGKYYYCIKDYYSGGNKRASKGDVVQALRGMNMMALGVKANEYFIPVNAIKQEKSWSEEDEKNWQGVIDEIEANKSDAPDYDVKTYDRFLSWLESLKQRLGGEK